MASAKIRNIEKCKEEKEVNQETQNDGSSFNVQ
jgi:hypothetical protein